MKSGLLTYNDITGPTSLALGPHTSYHHPPAGGTWHCYINSWHLQRTIWFGVAFFSTLFGLFDLSDIFCGNMLCIMKVMFLLYSNNEGRCSLCTIDGSGLTDDENAGDPTIHVPWPSLGWGTFAFHVERLSTNQKRLQLLFLSTASHRVNEDDLQSIFVQLEMYDGRYIRPMIVF